MPAQTVKSGLYAKLGDKLRKAVAATKGNETTVPGGGDLPAGIEGGIARLVDCRFGQYKEGPHKGEYFFIAAGVVVRPKEVNGVPIEGLRTQIMEPVCDTPEREGDKARKSLQNHVDWVLNMMRMLGADTADMAEEDLEATAAALKEAGPYFRFRTWQGKPTPQFPNPRVNQTWGLAVKDYVPEGEEPVVDNTATAEVADDTTEEPLSEGAEAEAGAPWEGDDLMETGKAADGKGPEAADAARKLQELAEAAEVQGVADLPDWVSVAAAIMEANISGALGPHVEAEANGAAAWDKEDMCFYKPPKARKRVECQVTAVFAGVQKANLKNQDDGKTIYKSVPWDEMHTEQS